MKHRNMNLPKIGVASTDWSQTIFDNRGHPVAGGAGWVRLEQSRESWTYPSATGGLVHNDTFGFGVVDFDGMVHFDCSVIIMQRMMFKDLTRTMSLAKQRPVRPYIINDLDDWYWGLLPSNAAYSVVQPANNPEENIDHYRKILELSDMVVVSTPFLYDKVSNFFGHPNVKLIENGVSTKHFAIRRHTPRNCVIGWVGSTSHRSRDLEELNGILDPHWKYHHSGHMTGAQTFAEATGVPLKSVTVAPMLPPRDYARFAFQFDIGLAPLSKNDFNKAKSWIKMIEYAACGIPCVASDSPEYVRLHETYGIGRIASNAAEWRSHLEELQDYETRRAEGRLMLERVKELSVDKMTQSWNDIFASIL